MPSHLVLRLVFSNSSSDTLSSRMRAASVSSAAAMASCSLISLNFASSSATSVSDFSALVSSAPTLSCDSVIWLSICSSFDRCASFCDSRDTILFFWSLMIASISWILNSFAVTISAYDASSCDFPSHSLIISTSLARSVSSSDSIVALASAIAAMRASAAASAAATASARMSSAFRRPDAIAPHRSEVPFPFVLS